MAERRYPEGTRLGVAVVSAALAAGSRIWQGVKGILSAPFADGTLAAAGRQGLDELGEALKPFPESIQVQESGTIWNPTQGEIAADRKPQEGLYGRSYPLAPQATPLGSHTYQRMPSDIAEGNRYEPGQEHGRDGHEHRREM